MNTNTGRCFFAALFLASALAAGCSPSQPASPSGQEEAPAAPPALEVREARIQMMPQIAGGYLQVVNQGGLDRLMRVESPQAADIQLHESIDEEEVIRMREAKSGFPIPASGSLDLAPGGKHLMLFGIVRQEGRTTLPLTLHFERHDPISVQATLMEQGSSSSR